MRTYLEYKTGSDRHGLLWLDVLRRDGPEQTMIQRWCKKNKLVPDEEGYLDSMARFHGQPNVDPIPGDVLPCEEWEGNLIEIACLFNGFQELSEWETTTGNKRQKHHARVSKLARELAALLVQKPHPDYPAVMEFFDEDKSAAIIDMMTAENKRIILPGTIYGDQKYLPVGEAGKTEPINTSHRLVEWIWGNTQQWPSLLNRLADFSDDKSKEQRRISRPQTGNPNARAFALYLSSSFKSTYDCTPNEVIAACVYLKYPDLDPPPNADTIRDWRGVK